MELTTEIAEPANFLMIEVGDVSRLSAKERHKAVGDFFMLGSKVLKKTLESDCACDVELVGHRIVVKKG